MSYKVTDDNKSNLPLNSRIDAELEHRVTRATRRICENLHIIANEPSLALYRISEHVRKALPPTVESRCEVKRLHAQLTGAHCDAEYGLENIKAMEESLPTFGNIECLLHKCVTLQHQLNHAPHKRVKKGGAGSIYQRFSAHLASVDIPDLTDFRESARETAHRVESAINKDKPSQKACTRSKSELGESSLSSVRRATWGSSSRADRPAPPAATAAAAADQLPPVSSEHQHPCKEEERSPIQEQDITANIVNSEVTSSSCSVPVAGLQPTAQHHDGPPVAPEKP